MNEHDLLPSFSGLTGESTYPSPALKPNFLDARLRGRDGREHHRLVLDDERGLSAALWEFIIVKNLSLNCRPIDRSTSYLQTSNQPYLNSRDPPEQREESGSLVKGGYKMLFLPLVFRFPFVPR